MQKYFACDPTVTDVEWFLLVDEPTRNGKNRAGKSIGGGWQSGLLTAGGVGVSTPKAAYSELASLFAAGRAACTVRMVTWKPGPVTAAAKPSGSKSTIASEGKGRGTPGNGKGSGNGQGKGKKKP